MLLNIRIQWNAGTACVSECVLKTLACRGLHVGPSKLQNCDSKASVAASTFISKKPPIEQQHFLWQKRGNLALKLPKYRLIIRDILAISGLHFLLSWLKKFTFWPEGIFKGEGGGGGCMF